MRNNYYVDTSVLVSYLFESETGHHVSRRVLEDAVRRGVKLYASAFTLVELYSAVCRKLRRERRLRLVEPLQFYVDRLSGDEEVCRFLVSAMVSFLRERLGVEFADREDLYLFEEAHGVRLPRIFGEAIGATPRLPIRIKDLLHLVYAYALSRTYGIGYFPTRDVEDFEKVRGAARRGPQIEIVLVR